MGKDRADTGSDANVELRMNPGASQSNRTGESSSSLSQEPEAPISLGLEEIVSPPHFVQGYQSPKQTSDEVSDDAIVGLDAAAGRPLEGEPPFSMEHPLMQLYLQSRFSELRSETESTVEQQLREALTVEKLWWLSASVALEVPEPFLLGAVSEVQSASVAPDGTVGEFALFVAEAARRSGAVLLEAELRRVIRSRVTSRSDELPVSQTARLGSLSVNSEATRGTPVRCLESRDGQSAKRESTADRLGKSGDNPSLSSSAALARTGGSTGTERFKVFLSLGVLSVALFLFLVPRNSLGKIGDAARFVLSDTLGLGETFGLSLGVVSASPVLSRELTNEEALISSAPPLVGIVLPTAAPQSALDQVLSRLSTSGQPEGAQLGERRSVDRGVAAGSQVAQASAPSGQGAAATVNGSVGAGISGTTSSVGMSPPIRVTLNVESPQEPERVREAIASGDPVERRRDVEVADRLFGSPQPVMRPPNESPQTGLSARSSAGSRDAADPDDASSDNDFPIERFDRLRPYRIAVRTMVTQEARFIARRVTHLQPGTRVFADAVAGPFLRVRLSGGGTGFILEQDAEPLAP